MSREIILFFSLFFLFSCEKTPVNGGSEGWNRVSERFEYKEDNQFYKVKLGRFSYDLKKNEIPLKKIMFLNASLVAYVSELGFEDRITGISSPEYIYSESLQRRIKSGEILNIGSEQKYDVEKIIKNKPDAIFSNYIETYESTYEVLRQNGIKIIFIDEFLESKPLDKSAYLLLFGKLLGAEEHAFSVYNTIKKSYIATTQLVAQDNVKPTVISSEVYGGFWYLPGGESNIANFIKDANAKYILTDKETKSLPFSFEEVYSRAKSANIWVNAGNHTSKADLLNAFPNYKKMDVFNNGKIYAAIAREKGFANDFYLSGQVRADLVLKDYAAIFHPELFKGYRLYYLKEIN